MIAAISGGSRSTDGFVVNTYRNPSPQYLRLHRASCRSISGTPANGASWTKGYVKVCGDRRTLETWAKQNVWGDLRPCPACT